MTARMRAAGGADGPLLNRLVRQAFTPYLPLIDPPPAPLSTDYAELLADSQCWIAERDDGAAGFVLCRRLDERRLLVHTIAVAPRFQGTGLGGRLLGRAESEARRQALDCVELSTNVRMHANIRWYLARGYELVGRGTQDGRERVFFRKTLPGGP